MNSEQFGKTYLQYERNIEKVLREKKIYDEDLMHDTYIALYEYSQKGEIGDFVNAFVEFYKRLSKRRDEYNGHYEACDYATMVEKYDGWDEYDWEYRLQVGRRVDKILSYYASHPLPGERHHKRAVKILRLYCQGLNECEISDKLKISQPAVSQTLERAFLRLKLIAK